MMLTYIFNHGDMQLSTQGNTYSSHQHGTYVPTLPQVYHWRLSKIFPFHAVFGEIWQNRGLTQPWRVDTPASGTSWIHNCICWTLRFKSGTANIKECLKEKYN